jgi:hypothetical protein
VSVKELIRKWLFYFTISTYSSLIHSYIVPQNSGVVKSTI